MKILKWLFEEPKPKTDKDLQSELKALVQTVLAQQYISSEQSRRYESLLKEIYDRGLEPESRITRGGT